MCIVHSKQSTPGILSTAGRTTVSADTAGLGSLERCLVMSHNIVTDTSVSSLLPLSKLQHVLEELAVSRLVYYLCTHLSCLRQLNDALIDGMSRGVLSEARNLHLHRRHPCFGRRVCDATPPVARSLVFVHALPVARCPESPDKKLRELPFRLQCCPRVTPRSCLPKTHAPLGVSLPRL